jgi:diguanylate cyclase (GGDEF)-like protein
MDHQESDAGQRETARSLRVREVEEHVREAAERDELASRRDWIAAERDRAAQKRDRAIAEMDGALTHGSPAEIAEHLKRLLTEAASDRVLAAADRELAADDRARAAKERAEALEALEEAHFDDLTGAHRRGFGEEMLRAEIERARRRDERLALVMVDVDGLKEVNDTDGHFAGDELLRDVVAAIRANIRSYEPIVRLGGDEFAFTIAGVGLDGAHDRCTVIRADLARRPSRGRISVGCSELRPDDDLAELCRRADTALVEARKRRSRITSEP